MNKLNKFQASIEKQLIDFKENHQYLPPVHPKKRWEYLEVTDNLYPPIRHGFMQYAYDNGVEFHDYVKHVRSSQVFGFNIIYPVIQREEDAVSVFNRFIPNKLTSIEKWFFEYQPENNELGEWKGENRPIKYVTSVDFAIFGINTMGNKVVVLIEVKFTEDNFSECGGYKSNANNDKDFCSKNFSKNEISRKCYLVMKKHRKYFEYLHHSYKWTENGVCPFRDNNQCMRNHAFANALKEKGMADKSYFGVLYHERNKEIEFQWNHYKDFCTEKERQNLFEIKANDFVLATKDSTLNKYYNDRYHLKT
jgi:hypothetical protein